MINELITYAQNKLARLNERLLAEKYQGNVGEIMKLEIEIQEVEQTLEKLRS